MTQAVERKAGDRNRAGDEVIQLREDGILVVACHECGLLYEVTKNCFMNAKGCFKCRIKRRNEKHLIRYREKKGIAVDSSKEQGDPFALSKQLDPIEMWQRIRRQKDDDALKEIALSQRKS